jgi:uncharacterized YigZ family protein
MEPTSEPIRTILRQAEFSLTIKRSRFIGRTYKRSSPQEALAAAKDAQERYRDADHNCWAYRAGTTGEQARYDDDGEPGGTAGPPILEVLKRSRVTNTLVVVTRYFGGIKLGAGGLVRAYGDAAKGVLAESGFKDLRWNTHVLATVPYALLAAIEKFAEQEGFEVVSRVFQENVTLGFRVPAEREPDFRAFFANLVGGKSSLLVTGEEFS